MTVGQQDGVAMKYETCIRKVLGSDIGYTSAIFYISPSRKISVQYLKLDHEQFVVVISFLIHYSSIILQFDTLLYEILQRRKLNNRKL
jgi:hypothetical protein